MGALAINGGFGGMGAGMGAIDWNSIIGRGFDFGNNVIAQWGNRQAYRSGINPNAPAGTYQPVSYVSNTQPAGITPVTPGVGFGLDSQGIRLSDGSHIGWLPIAGVVVGLKLLQAKPYRRG
jgi:hypothetical protein